VLERLSQPWPWWIAGPLIGLIVPLLLLFGGKLFGISSSLRHACAALPGRKPSFFSYDWKRAGAWNLAFALGLVLGGLVAATVLASTAPIELSEATWRDLTALGIARQAGMAPAEVFAWDRLATPAALVSLLLGGFFLGFGARWASGCTSGHAISGLASRQLPSLLAVIGFFAGGLAVTHLVLPWLLG